MMTDAEHDAAVAVAVATLVDIAGYMEQSLDIDMDAWELLEKASKASRKCQEKQP